MKMTTNHGYILTDASGEPVSRTYQYRKVMKPMLERKRRARINRCLDELKELMTGALQNEGENVAKLEKADILELTVRHLHNIRRQTQLSGSGGGGCGGGGGGGGQTNETTYADRFKAGFRQCAAEVTHFLGTLDEHTSVHVLKHLNGCIKKFELYHQQQQQQQQQMQLTAPEPVLSSSPQSSRSISPHQHNQTATPSPPPPPAVIAQPILNQSQIQHTHQVSQQSPSSAQQTQSIKQEINGNSNRIIINRNQTPPPWIRNLRSTNNQQQQQSHQQQQQQPLQSHQHESTTNYQQLNSYTYSTNSIKVRPLSAVIGYSTSSSSSSSSLSSSLPSSSTITSGIIKPILNIEMLSPKIDVEDHPVWRPW